MFTSHPCAQTEENQTAAEALGNLLLRDTVGQRAADLAPTPDLADIYDPTRVQVGRDVAPHATVNISKIKCVFNPDFL